MRLDRYLVEKTELPRNQAQKLIKLGRVVIDGRVVKKPSHAVLAASAVTYSIPEGFGEVSMLPEKTPLAILFEDDAILVVDKPAGLVVHPSQSTPKGTLVNALLSRYPDLPHSGEDWKPGIVHRLDKGTSGCLVVAKTAAALADLQRQFRDRQVEKTYVALVTGQPPLTGEIDMPIGRHPKHRRKMSIHTLKPREAQTEWKVLETFRKGKYSWLQIRIRTGRTHQIRVHFSAIGHPIVADMTYGRGNREIPLGRTALHAWKLKFTHPETKEMISFSASFPSELQSLLEDLRAFP